MTELTLKRDSIPEIGMSDFKNVTISKHYVTLFSIYQTGSGEENCNMVMLDRKEALELFNFLKENL